MRTSLYDRLAFWRRLAGGAAAVALAVAPAWALFAAEPSEAAATAPAAVETAREIDRLIVSRLQAAGGSAAPLVGDEDFLRRVSFDLAGEPPSPREAALFGLDPDPGKRTGLIDELLDSERFVLNWSRYWRDVIFTRATNMRAPLAQSAFEEWMAARLRENRPWDEIATAMITASGDVREHGEAALMFAQEGEAADIAAEVSRIFLGIQIQCANCHDHPTDAWKREQFHQLAAFFPRVGVRPKRDGQRILSYEIVSVDFSRQGRGGPTAYDPERLFRLVDRNRDGKLSKQEAARSPLAQVFDRFLEQGDRDKDGFLSLDELKQFRQPAGQPGRGSAEHYMPDLNNPSARGTPIDPALFATGQELESGQRDAERREALARWLTSPENPWFARAIVNRVWAELLGEGFYKPVDDLGPERAPSHPEALAALTAAFTTSGYDLKWLFRTIANTDAYQRQVRARSPEAAEASFACASPTRIRSDQLYSALLAVAGAAEPDVRDDGGPGGFYRRARSPRAAFNRLFGFDPSTPQEDITGSIPQALFLMNSPQIAGLTRAAGRTRLSQLLRQHDDDRDVISELYLLVLAREPSETELAICAGHVRSVGNRPEAFEDVMWSLVNSSEFLTKR